VKTITLHQPWASLIACGLKTIETRTHDRFRSLVGETVAIHAGKRSGPGPSYRFMIKHNIREDYYDEALEHASTHRGCIVCVVLAIGHKRLSVLEAIPRGDSGDRPTGDLDLGAAGELAGVVDGLTDKQHGGRTDGRRRIP
jgi:hypothetical protein